MNHYQETNISTTANMVVHDCLWGWNIVDRVDDISRVNGGLLCLNWCRVGGTGTGFILVNVRAWIPTTNKSGPQKLTLIQSIQARLRQIIKMKASGYFVGWNLSSIKSLVSNYQTGTVGGMEGWRVTLSVYLYWNHPPPPPSSLQMTIYITAFPSDRQA